MDSLYIGSPQPYLRCPNTGMLIVVPGSRRAFLSSASCEFVCQERGGPEVVMSTLVALDAKGTAAAVTRGVEEVYHFLTQTSSMSDTIVTTANQKAGFPNSDLFTTPPNVSNFLQRLSFGLAIVFLAVSLIVGLIVVLIAPGFVSKRRR